VISPRNVDHGNIKKIKINRRKGNNELDVIRAKAGDSWKIK